jgi:uncharacterized protein YndB with AHSA1/START domain
MTVTSVDKNLEALTMSITSEFEASIDAVWQMWENPRRLERWWGPPTYPATVVDFDFSPGGNVSYFMTSPEGDKYRGWWRVLSIEAPHRLEFEDGFADDAGVPNLEMPVTRTRVSLDAQSGTTRMMIETNFPSAAAMEQMVEMGMEEGMSAALGQIDEMLKQDAAAR